MSKPSGGRWLPRLAATSIAIFAIATAIFVGFLLWWSSKLGSTRPERATEAPPVAERVAAEPSTQQSIEAQRAAPTVQRTVAPPVDATPVTLISAPPAVGSSSSSDIEKNKAIARGLADLAKDPKAAARFGVPP